MAKSMNYDEIYINTAGNTMEILLYGMISKWTDVSGRRIANRLANLSTNIKTVRFFMNSDGGSVVEGIVIFNQLRRLIAKGIAVELIVDGAAASMAAVLLQVPGAKRMMAKYTRLMMHEVSGMAFGTSTQIRAVADEVDSFQVDLIDIVATRTGLDKEKVKSKWFNGKDNWITADDALSAKLIDEVIDGKIKGAPQNFNDVNDVVNFYDEQIVNFNEPNNKEMERIEIINQLGLPEAATDIEIKNALAAAKISAKRVTDLEAENKDLRDAEALKQQAEVKNIIDKAIGEKKIVEKQRASYVALFAVDFKNAKQVLEDIAPATNLAKFGAGDNTPVAADRKDWSFTDWQKKDGTGLKNLKDNHFEDVYKPLYKKAFDKDPQ